MTWWFFFSWHMLAVPLVILFYLIFWSQNYKTKAFLLTDLQMKQESRWYGMFKILVKKKNQSCVMGSLDTVPPWAVTASIIAKLGTNINTTNKHIIVIPRAVKAVTVAKTPPFPYSPLHTTQEWAGFLDRDMTVEKGWLISWLQDRLLSSVPGPKINCSSIIYAAKWNDYERVKILLRYGYRLKRWNKTK